MTLIRMDLVLSVPNESTQTGKKIAMKTFMSPYNNLIARLILYPRFIVNDKSIID